MFFFCDCDSINTDISRWITLELGVCFLTDLRKWIYSAIREIEKKGERGEWEQGEREQRKVSRATKEF